MPSGGICSGLDSAENGKDSNGVPYIVITCTDCLRSCSAECKRGAEIRKFLKRCVFVLLEQGQIHYRFFPFGEFRLSVEACLRAFFPVGQCSTHWSIRLISTGRQEPYSQPKPKPAGAANALSFQPTPSDRKASSCRSGFKS